VSNEAINESLKNLSMLSKTNAKKEEDKTQDLRSKFFPKPFFLIMILVVIGLIFLFILVLPLKLKGSLFKKIGLSTKALTLFEKAAIKHPMDPEIHIKTAQIYEKLGREEEAMNEYKIASKVLDMKED
jgi:tetratricopeptide (TPR) repeat protein